LTKHHLTVDTVAAPKGDGAPEIVVSRAMREAGASVIEELNGVVSASGLAEAVYIAMATAPISVREEEPPGHRKRPAA